MQIEVLTTNFHSHYSFIYFYINRYIYIHIFRDICLYYFKFEHLITLFLKPVFSYIMERAEVNLCHSLVIYPLEEAKNKVGYNG